jgi:hypothetical protein
MSTYVANCIYGYGIAYAEYQAVANLAAHITTDKETIEVTVAEVDGFNSVSPGHIDAEEVHRSRVLAIDAADMERLVDLSIELEIAAEETIADAEELERDIHD